MRDHELFEGPHRIDRTALRDVEVPEHWRDKLPGSKTVAMLSLCDKLPGGMPGWCTSGADIRGVETEIICGGNNSKGPDYAGIWRQGNLLHFGFEPSPAQYNEHGRKLLLNSIAYIAAFATDRPIQRESSPFDPNAAKVMTTWRLEQILQRSTASKDLAEWFAAPWNEQIHALEPDAARAFVRERLGALRNDAHRATFDPHALTLGLDRRKVDSLRQAARMLQAEREPAAARAFLQALLPEADPDATPNNWYYWIDARADMLTYDDYSHRFRFDPVASARGVPTTGLSGPLRADRAVRTADAAALASKVARRHGGRRALQDLHTFTCRVGEVHHFWNRREGLFRVDSTATPTGRGTRLKVAVFDIAADRDLITSGGNGPPIIGARTHYHDVLELSLLPLLLEDPTTSVALDAPAEDGAVLIVQLAGDAVWPRKVFRLTVDGDGNVLRLAERRDASARDTAWKITGTAQVGPMLILSAFEREGRNPQRREVLDPQWNPELRADTFTNKEPLR